MTKLHVLLALAAGMLLINLYGCETPGGTIDDDDTSVNDDDDDDDDDTGTVIFTVDETLPTVQVVESRLDSEERTMTECETVCTLTEIPAGHYSGEAMLENGLFAPIEFDLGVDQTFTHTFAGGFVHDGTYARYLDEDGTQQIGDTTFDVSTYVDDNMVKTSIQSVNTHEVEGDTITAIGSSNVYGTTLVPNDVIEYHAVDGNVFCFIKTDVT